MRVGLVCAAAITAMALAAPAMAQDGAIRTAHAAIGNGDYDRAEQLLAAERRIFPQSPEVLINLAAVYARTGRSTQASTLYRQIMAQPDVLLDLSNDRAVSSHALAQAGLRRVNSLQTAAR
jgi:Flp pilus assembly protein TadD